MNELTALEIRIGVGTKEGKLCVQVDVNDMSLDWPADRASRIGQEWINKGIEGIKDCTAFEISIDGITGLATPENLLQAGVGLTCAAYCSMV